MLDFQIKNFYNDVFFPIKYKMINAGLRTKTTFPENIESQYQIEEWNQKQAWEDYDKCPLWKNVRTLLPKVTQHPHDRQ